MIHTKPKYINFTRNQNEKAGRLKFDGPEFEQVDEFKYLGTIASNQNTKEPQTQNMLNSANKYLNACKQILTKVHYIKQ